MSDERSYAFIDRIAKLAGVLGFNETQVRWKLLRMREEREGAREQARAAAAHVGYEHAVCGNCGRILPRGTKTCPSCESRLEPRFVQMLRRAGMHAPVPLSVATLLGLILMIAFARQLVAQPSGMMGFSGETLARLGAHMPYYEAGAHQWWRLGTAVLLHGGILHLVFNLVALSQVTPLVEDVVGPGRTLFIFTVTGIVANVPTLLMGRNMIGIGASGAIMGLIGLAAAWGHREATSHGIMVRNAMLKWLLYTTLIGLMLPVDHSAHLTGFAGGAVLGLAFHGVTLRRGPADAAFGLAGTVVLLGLLGLVLLPPALP